MYDAKWQPRCELPDDLVRPMRLDPTGVTGPTRGQARGPHYRQTSHGWYVPSEVDEAPVEQRILEQSMRVIRRGAGIAAVARCQLLRRARRRRSDGPLRARVEDAWWSLRFGGHGGRESFPACCE